LHYIAKRSAAVYNDMFELERKKLDAKIGRGEAFVGTFSGCLDLEDQLALDTFD